MTRYLFTVSEAHMRPYAGTQEIRLQAQQARSVLGRVLAVDIGKRIYAVRSDDGLRDVIVVENSMQQDKRLGILTDA